MCLCVCVREREREVKQRAIFKKLNVKAFDIKIGFIFLKPASSFSKLMIVSLFSVHLCLTKIDFSLNFPVESHKVSLFPVYYTPIRQLLISENILLK